MGGQAPQAIYNTPAVIEGVLYVGTASPLGNMYAFDVEKCASGSCRPLWKSSIAVGTSSPTVSHGAVYVGSQQTGLYAFDADGCGQRRCDPIWIGQTGGYVLNSPAVVKGVVYVGSESGDFLAFDADGCGAASRQPIWTADVSAPIYDVAGSVARDRLRRLVRCGPNSFVYAFDADGARGDVRPVVAWHRRPLPTHAGSRVRARLHRLR